jgi:hypothetical protein
MQADHSSPITSTSLRIIRAPSSSPYSGLSFLFQLSDDLSRVVCLSSIHHPLLRANAAVCSCLIKTDAADSSIHDILANPEPRCASCVRNPVAASEFRLSRDLWFMHAHLLSHGRLPCGVTRDEYDMRVAELPLRDLLVSSAFADLKLVRNNMLRHGFAWIFVR